VVWCMYLPGTAHSSTLRVSLLFLLAATCSSSAGFAHPAFQLASRPLPRASHSARSLRPSLAGVQTAGMILDKLAVLRTATIVLASASPRRKEILNDILGMSVKVVASTFEENLDKSLFTPAEYVQENARLKALEVFERMTRDGEHVDLVIGGDTVVAHKGQILEKPRDEAHAKEMLASLSGATHTVYSGVSLVFANGGAAPSEVRCFAEETSVTFAPLSEELIAAYVASGEPMDKAGAYGIQASGGVFVSGINGCFYNVMGFPMHRFSRELSESIEQGAMPSLRVSAQL